MKIINFHAENVKGIKVVDISPEDNTVIISGENGAGKSSVLDAIYWALCGMGKADKIPVRTGEERAVIRLDVGQDEVEYIIERKIGKTNTLTIKTPEGATFNSPQAMLDLLVGKIAFDPLEFFRLKPADQLREIRKLVDFDFDALDAQNKIDYDERTNVNRDAKQIESQLRAIVLPETVPETLIDVSEKSKIIVAISEKRQRAVGHYQLLQSAEQELAEAKAKLQAAQEKRDTYGREYDALRQGVATKEEIAILQGEIQNAETLNNAFRTQAQNDKLCQELQLKSAESQKLTQAIERRDAEKKKAMDGITFEGISNIYIEEGNIILDNVPLEQCSSAERLKVAIFIAIWLNPKLRVIRIKDGALLDKASMEMLKRSAKLKDYQLWIERVGKEPLSIVMQDGYILGGGQ